MTIFDSSSGRGRVIDGGGGRGVFGLIGLAIAGLVVVVLLFNSVTRVGTGRVGVLTLFGRVTGETLPEGMHLINPLKTNSHTANALYTGEREIVAKQIYDQLTSQLNQRGLLVENVLLRDIQLPATLKAAIEAKQQAEQESLAMNFRLQKETQEAQRKRIEASGIRDFQQIVAQGITPSLLEWKGIEATESLAKSANAKIVVVGNSKNGLPLILGQ